MKNRSFPQSVSEALPTHQPWLLASMNALLACTAWVMQAWFSPLPAVAQDAAPQLAPGISATRPESGPHVALADGTFMVPYTQKVDSTEIVFEMLPIPGGEFVMGSPDSESGRLTDEGPQFTVVVEPFWMAKTELTWAEYKTFMKTYDIFKRLSRQGIRKATSLDESDAITVPTPLYEPSHTFEHGDDNQQPAVTMTQYAAKQYTKWLSGITSVQYRLPTEAEWEYAARAGSTTAYSFGDDPAELDAYAAFADNSPEGAPRVGSKKPNPFGLHDMHGSVWEWTIDQYDAQGYGDRAGKKLSVAQSIGAPTSNEMRCVRGGGWQDTADRLRSAARMGSADEEWKDFDPNVPLSPWWYTTDPARMVGMRLVRSSVPLPVDTIRAFWNVDNEDTKEDINYRLQEGRGVLGKPVPELTEEYKRKR